MGANAWDSYGVSVAGAACGKPTRPGRIVATLTVAGAIDHSCVEEEEDDDDNEEQLAPKAQAATT